MSPILVRPVREQLEHDRIIRLLQAKCRRKYEVGINPAAEQNAGVGEGAAAVFPDLVLMGQERGHRLHTVIEVETGESVNHLEALAEWANYGKLRAAFHLYVPAGMVDVARRLCEENQVRVNEIWSYHTVADEVRFTLVHRSREAPPAPAPRPRAAATPATATPAAARPATPATARPTTRPATARPATTRPATARPATARPATARPATARPATARPATARRKTAARPKRLARPRARVTARKTGRSQKRK